MFRCFPRRVHGHLPLSRPAARRREAEAGLCGVGSLIRVASRSSDARVGSLSQFQSSPGQGAQNAAEFAVVRRSCRRTKTCSSSCIHPCILRDPPEAIDYVALSGNIRTKHTELLDVQETKTILQSFVAVGRFADAEDPTV